ncbi:MAG: peptidyl-prolyl cis-trans isomerase [Acidobacteriia bacterium]|nr:peptidyl-prolyl cis-trans isomerase [Terriglobia bacterium]
MAGILDNRKTLVRIFIGIVIGLLAVSMLLYLVPQGPATGDAAPDTVARIGDQSVTVSDVREQLAQISSRGQIPKQLEGLYAQQILNQLVFQKELELEGRRLGIHVSDEERADRIRQFLPTAFSGGTFVGMDRYSAEVQSRFGMNVPQFEELVRQGLLEEKFRRLVTDGISVSPLEIQEEFRYRNQKITLAYAYIKPEDLDAQQAPGDVAIQAEFEKNKAKYQVPERRVVRYALADLNQLRQSIQLSDDELKALYQSRIQLYQVPNRVHVQHILFRTTGKTDAEVAEIRKKAEDVLKLAQKGAKFEDLAKKYSEDTTKDKGGDLGWIEQGQTVAEFEKAAFSLAKGGISPLVRTQFGFHIIKAVDRETAHTKSFDEVKESLRAPLSLEKADQRAADQAEQIAAAVRKSNRGSLEDLAGQFHLSVAETRPVAATDVLLELGNSQEIKDAIFRLHQGELGLPIRTDRGYVVLTVKEILPAHAGTLSEVRDRVLADLKRTMAAAAARSRAEELARRVKAGEKFPAAAKSLGLESKTSDSFARNGSISGVASGRQLASAFRLNSGEAGAPLSLGNNWLVYQVVAKEEPDPANFDRDKQSLAEQVLQNKRNLAFEAFRTGLQNRLKQEGKLQLMPERMKNFTGQS